MTLVTGGRLGAYEILGPLGAGGMGEVYRARDPRLNREVAIKVLPPQFTDDPPRLARFEREARLLASLQNPRIAAIHGLEESEGQRFLVMELVRGETLAARLARGALAVEDALEMSRQIAEGLEAAHDQGIVHRDLKPSNIQVEPGGSVKLLDFGLAKALDAEVPAEDGGRISHSPTLSAPMTGMGMILGTAGYMSPEQARGRPVDRKADIWAFGCVLYEMVSGQRAFEGETVSDTLAAVLRASPEWSRVPPDVPPTIRRLLARCLEKDPKRRLHDIADARIEVEEALQEIRGGHSAAGAPFVPAPAASPIRRWLAPAAVAVGLAALAAAFAMGRSTAARMAAPTASAATRALVALPPDRYLAGHSSPVLALSRDGRRLAFVATADNAVPQLYVHHLDSGQTQLVPGSETAEGPFFSPDGAWVAFAIDVSGAPRPGQLKKFSLATGLTQSICGIRDYFGGDWLDDGTILLVEVRTDGLRKVPAAGGRLEPVLTSVRIDGHDAPVGLLWPQGLPGGQSLLVTYDGPSFREAAVLDLGSRELRPLGLDTPYARYASTGHLVFLQQDGTLLAAPFDPSTGRTTGSPVAMARDVAVGNLWGGAFSVSRSGTLAYATGYLRGSGRELSRLVMAAPKTEPRPLAFEPDTLDGSPRLSPDGNRIAVVGWDGSLWIYDPSRGSRSRLPQGGAADRLFPIWTPDGERVVFASTRGSGAGWKLFWQRADGSADPEPLRLEGVSEKRPGSMTPDGRTLLFNQSENNGFHLLPVGGKTESHPFLPGRGLDAPTLSPDGQWLAYQSSETGQSEIYVRKFPDLGSKLQVSSGGGRSPRWTRDGRRIFYRNRERVHAAGFEPGAIPRVSAPELFAEIPLLRGFDVLPDGSAIVAKVLVPDSGVVRHVQLVVNWSEELRRLGPTP